MGSTQDTCCDSNRRTEETGNDINQDIKLKEQNFNDTKFDHRPKDNNIKEIKEMNMERLSDKVRERIKQLGDFRPNYEPADNTDGLPTLGPYLYPDNTIYQGQYNKGQRFGEGKLIQDDGSQYEGSWGDDQKNGKGRLLHLNGDKYFGDWKNDNIEGHGIYTHDDGLLIQMIYQVVLMRVNGLDLYQMDKEKTFTLTVQNLREPTKMD